MRKYDVIIRNGKIVTASDMYQGDIGIKDEKIVEIGTNIEGDAVRTIDAKGKFVFPGGVDEHTHLDMPFGGTFSSDNFETGTKAAACGGTTTVVDFSVQPNGKTLADTVKIWREKADQKACIDYGIHLQSLTSMKKLCRKYLLWWNKDILALKYIWSMTE
jgi:dihydropyrimidinase